MSILLNGVEFGLSAHRSVRKNPLIDTWSGAIPKITWYVQALCKASSVQKSVKVMVSTPFNAKKKTYFLKSGG